MPLTRVVLVATVTVFILATAAFLVRGDRNAEMFESGKEAALIRVAREMPEVVPSAGQSVESKDEYLDLLTTYAKLLKSQFVINAALRDDKVIALARQAAGKRDPADWLADQLSVVTGEGQLLSVTLKPGAISDASQRAKLVNAVVNAFMTEVVNSEREELLRRQNQLELTLTKTRKDLQDKLRAFADVRRLQGADLYDIKLRMGEQRLAQLGQRRDAIAFHKLALEADLAERLAANEKKEPPSGVAADETVPVLNSQIRAADYQIAQIESQITSQYEKLSQLQLPSMDLESRAQELKQLRDLLDKRGIQVRESRLKLEAKPRVSIIQTANVPAANK